jgi:hypothetical protein
MYFIYLLSALIFSNISVSSFTFNSNKPGMIFDPLGFSNDKPCSELVRLREAELKHGRWGMIASTAIPVTELVTHCPAIHVLDNADPVVLSLFSLIVAQSEFQSMLLGWENPYTNTSNVFKMKENYQPGDLGFVIPFSFMDKDSEFMLDAEINNGRLAMISALGMIVQELVNNKPIF